MGYTIDAGNVNLARERVEELKKVETEFESAVGSLGNVPGLLREAADCIDGLPVSDVIRSYAEDVRKILADMLGCFEGIVKDRKELSEGILIFEKETK